MPNSKIAIEKLEKIQFCAIRAAIGYRKSTPTNILLAESKTISIKERSKLLCNRFLSKSLFNSSSPFYKIIFNYFKFCMIIRTKRKTVLRHCVEDIMYKKSKIERSKHFNIYCFNYETIISAIPVDFDLGLKLQNSNNPNSTFTDFLSNTNSLNIFTDGSKILENKLPFFVPIKIFKFQKV